MKKMILATLVLLSVQTFAQNANNLIYTTNSGRVLTVTLGANTNLLGDEWGQAVTEAEENQMKYKLCAIAGQRPVDRLALTATPFAESSMYECGQIDSLESNKRMIQDDDYNVSPAASRIDQEVYVIGIGSAGKLALGDALTTAIANADSQALKNCSKAGSYSAATPVTGLLTDKGIDFVAAARLYKCN